MRNKSLFFAIFVALLLVLGFLYFISGSESNITPASFFPSMSSADLTSGSKAITIISDTNTYTNDSYHFSLPLSELVKGVMFEEGGGDTILLKSDTYEMQIHITLFDEEISLTKERIFQDIPDIVMENAATVSVDGVAGVTFTSVNDEQMYREIWFVHGGYLYQTLSLASGDGITDKIMSGWKWL